MGSEVWLTEGRGALLQEGLSKGCGQKLDQELAGFQFLGELMSEPAGPRMWGGTHGWSVWLESGNWELARITSTLTLQSTGFGRTPVSGACQWLGIWRLAIPSRCRRSSPRPDPTAKKPRDIVDRRHTAPHSSAQYLRVCRSLRSVGNIPGPPLKQFIPSA